ncbi:MAG: hypothetical protein NTY63_09415 [Candidatus Bipolaricaulota bacterium]|nr:hypothetical protein [Candidatus Bipolaricaulota bacterium]
MAAKRSCDGAKAIVLATVLGVALTAFSLCAYGVRWSPAELDVTQSPGTEATYVITLYNDGEQPAELRIYVWDWVRTLEGQNDLGIAPNSVRWTFDRAFAAGEVVTVRYAARLPEGGPASVEGSYQSWSPQVAGAIAGPSEVPGEAPVGTGALGAAPALVTRVVESVSAEGEAGIALSIRPTSDFQGLTIVETYGERVELSCVECGGGTFDTVNRSCSEWISLSRDEATLQPGQSAEIRATVRTPTRFSGTCWSIVQAESRPVSLGEVAGTQIVARPTVGLKIFVTAPGTEKAEGRVIDVQQTVADPLTLQAAFENTGNVQLVVVCEAQIVDRNGAVVRTLRFEESGRDYFRILPGSVRVVTLVDASGVPLPAGVYQATVVFDFGGAGAVLGVRAFRIR